MEVNVENQYELNIVGIENRSFCRERNSHVYETLPDSKNVSHETHTNFKSKASGQSCGNMSKKKIGVIFALVLFVVTIIVLAILLGINLTSGEREDQHICSMLPLKQKGITVNTSQAKHGDVLDLQCSDIKSKLVGPSHITCLSSGTWSSEPSCELKRCTKFPTPQNAMILKEGLNYSEVEGKIEVVCNEGFDIVGSETVICMLNETWSAIPTCEPKDCGFPGNVTNGIIHGTERTTYNSTLKIRCDDGFNLSGESHVVCNKNGHWDKMPSCLPVTCGLPSVPNHGSITHINGTKYKDVVLVKCDDGFALQGGAIIQCSDKGTWRPNSNCTDIDECEISPCKNGAKCIDQEHGYTCNCTRAWGGTLCDQYINECLSNPCMNGATCVNGKDNYSCSCGAGYAGVNCQIDINECKNSPCENGATCHDHVNGFTCSFASDWNGTHSSSGSMFLCYMSDL